MVRPQTASRRGFFSVSVRLVLLGTVLATVGCTLGQRDPATRPDAATPAPADPAGQGESARPATSADDRLPAAQPPADPAASPGTTPTSTDPATVGQPPGTSVDVDADVDDADLLFTGEVISRSPLDEVADVDVDPEAIPAIPVEEETKEVTYDVPMVDDERVQFWLDYYTRRHRESFLPGMRRSGRYIDRFKQIFREEGVPEDLVYMAHVESAFKVTAYSRARARGIWQFIASTGRNYGLEIDYWVDWRSDPERAAYAAADYLNKLYRDFGDWHLALAAYNGGEGRVSRALKRTGAKDFWGLARTKHIRRETRNYVPAILAAIQIYKDSERFGMEYEPDAPIEWESVEVDGAVDLRVLADCAGSDYETLRLLNPALRRQQTPPSRKTRVHVPPGKGPTLLAALEKIPRNERVLYARHQVRRGESLSTIASAYGVSVRSIQQTNAMGRRTLIRTGQILKVPTGAASAQAAARYASAGGEPRVHRVRRGETLSRIARNYGTTTTAIARASGIGVHSTLQIGQRLVIDGGVAPAMVARSTPAASGPAVDHRIRRGETLYALARRYGTTPQAIAARNGISVRSTLRIGQRLKIPSGDAVAPPSAGGVHYTVRRGDSLWSIASAFRTSVDALCRINAIPKQAILYPGTRLRIR